MITPTTSYATQKQTHAEQYEAMYAAGKRDAEQRFPRGWSLKRDECEFCSRNYYAGYDDAIAAEVEQRR